MIALLLRGCRPYCILIIALLLIVRQGMVLANKILTHSFEPPFIDIDNYGSRMVSSGWRTSGSTVVSNNFVRLTPDQQVLNKDVVLHFTLKQSHIFGASQKSYSQHSAISHGVIHKC